jgi:hypothetical protein
VIVAVSQSTETAKGGTMKSQVAKSLVKVLALALGMACMQSASAQHFKHVSVTGGASLAQIASGGASVWALASNGKPYVLNAGTFVLANNIALTQIAVGGGNTLQKDTVWGLNSSGSIYKATKSGTSWVFSRVPGVLDFIAVGLGYQDSCHPYEVWGLNSAAQIYRYNFCIKNWDQVAGTLQILAVGSGEIWGLNANDEIFAFDFATLSFVSASLNVFTQVAIGPDDTWTLDPSGELWQLDVGSIVRGPLAQIQAGGNGVWALSPSQQVFRLEHEKGSLVQIPGAALVSISVGSGGGIWGLDISGKAYGFVTP